jgi:hypothetical protein
MVLSARSFVPVLVLAFGLSACSGNVCKKWQKEFDDCDSDDFSVDECEDQLAECDSDDEDLIDDFFKCMDDAGFFECDADLGTADFEAILACSEPLSALSEECQSSFGGTTQSAGRLGAGNQRASVLRR